MTLAFLKYNRLNCAYNPTLVGGWNGALFGAYADGYLYVTDQGPAYNSFIRIYDMGNPLAPVQVSQTPTELGAGAQFPIFRNNRLYMCYWNSKKLACWNVANKLAPVLLGAVEFKQPAVAGGFLGPSHFSFHPTQDIGIIAWGYGASGDKTHGRIDWTNPAAPVLTHSYRYDAAGNYGSYTAASPRGDVFYAITNRGNSGTAGLLLTHRTDNFTKLAEMPGGILYEIVSYMAVTKDGNWGYCQINGSNQLWVVNLSNPNALSFSRVSMTQTGTQTGTYHKIALLEDINRLYATRSNGGGLCIPIMDITNRGAPVPSGYINTGGETSSDVLEIPDGCNGLAYMQGTGAAVKLIGTPPLV